MLNMGSQMSRIGLGTLPNSLPVSMADIVANECICAQGSYAAHPGIALNEDFPNFEAWTNRIEARPVVRCIINVSEKD